VDRTVKDLQLTIEKREKANSQLQDDISRSRDKVEKLLKTIDELQSSESSEKLAARRAERALNEEREGRLRAERELEAWKSVKGGSAMGSVRRGSGWGNGNGTGSMAEENGIEIPKRKSSISRQTSLSKGFL
jgi:myosin protein heavy chain